MSSYSTRNRKFKKNSKKFKKIKKHHCCIFPSQNKLGKAEKEWRKKTKKKKKIVPMSSYPTRNKKFQKLANKIKKHYYGCFSRQNMLGKAEKEKNKFGNAE